ncbi:hypothetical protein KEM56_007485 [Ascosphaera pollenicola]|nr:hypothetical protein KEM56_007485 [Ascosphaera pollenicola]
MAEGYSIAGAAERSASDAGHNMSSPTNTWVPPTAQQTRPAPVRPRRPYSLTEGKHITRTRISYSCHMCRRRKVKCDKVHPTCSNCFKTGAQCVYDPAALAPLVPKKQARDFSRSSSPHHDSDHTHQRDAKRLRSESLSNGPGFGHDTPNGSISSRHGSAANIGDIAAQHHNAFLKEQSVALGLAPRDVDGQEIAARLDRLSNLVERWSRSDGLQWLKELDKAIQGQQEKEKERARDHESEQTPQDKHQHATSHSPATSKQTPFRGEVQTNDQRTERTGEPDFPVPEQDNELADSVGALNLGHLSLEGGGKSRYVGTTYWAYVSQEISELNQLLRDQYRSRESPPVVTGPRCVTPKDAPSGSVVSPRGRPQSRQDLLNRSVIFPSSHSPRPDDRVKCDMLLHIPSKRQSHILYKGFMSGVHALAPLLYPPIILEQYSAFWNWYEACHQRPNHDPFPCPSFIPLLYAIWYGGTVTVSLRTLSHEFDVDNRDLLSSVYHEEFTRWLKKIGFPRSPTFYGLTAFLLVQTILAKEEEPLTTSLFVSLALRVAQTMGLHRDPAQFKAISATEAEARRRVWWHIVHMDGVVAMSSGLPPLVSNEEFWDVRMTSEVKDILIGTRKAVEYEDAVDGGKRKPDDPDDAGICGGPSMVNVYYLAVKGKYKMSQATRRILRIQLGTKPITRRDMEELRNILVSLQAELRAIIQRIPMSPIPRPPGGDYLTENPKTILYNRPPSSVVSTAAIPAKCDLANGGPGCLEQFHNPILPAFHKWARILLLLYVDKAFCVAYQPFLKNAKSQIWPAARQGALRHCHGFMEKFITLATDPDFQPFQWSWPGNHQPMHATMIMLIDLYERPHSPEAFKSRAFIDKVFSLSGPDGGVVSGEDGISTARPLRDGGREAWSMLKRLRQKAWLKAGLDPELLWTEKAQERARVYNTEGQPMMPPRSRHFMSALSPQPSQCSPNSVPISFADDYFDLMDPVPSSNAHRPPNPRSVHSTGPEASAKVPGTESIPFCPPSTAQQMPARPANVNLPRPVMQYSSEALPEVPLHGMCGLLNQSTNQTVQTVPNVTSQRAPPVVPQTEPAGTQSFPTQSFPQTAFNYSDMPPLPPANPTNMVNALPDDIDMAFDWDEWNAVFGQDLPVVDAYMDLDMIINPMTSASTSAKDHMPGPGIQQTYDMTGGGMNSNGPPPFSGESGGMGKWADFG